MNKFVVGVLLAFTGCAYPVEDEEFDPRSLLPTDGSVAFEAEDLTHVSAETVDVRCVDTDCIYIGRIDNRSDQLVTRILWVTTFVTSKGTPLDGIVHQQDFHLLPGDSVEVQVDGIPGGVLYFWNIMAVWGIKE